MKKLIFVVIALLYGCSSTIIPGKLIDNSESTIAGDEKAYCVAPHARVGNSVSLPDGRLARIKSLSSESAQCKDPDKPLYALVYIPVKHKTDAAMLGIQPTVGTRIR